MFYTWKRTGPPSGCVRRERRPDHIAANPKGSPDLFFDARIPFGKSQATSKGEESLVPRRGGLPDGQWALWPTIGFLGSCRLLEASLKSRMCFSLFSLLQVFTKYGKCYMFNSGEDGKPLLTTVKGGTGNGLEIMLDIQQDEYLPIWGETGKLGIELGAVDGGTGVQDSERLVCLRCLGPPYRGLLHIEGVVTCQ